MTQTIKAGEPTALKQEAPMEKYQVMICEVYTQMVEVEAASPEDAMSRVWDGEGTYLDDTLEYSHTLDPDSWTVEKVI